MTRTFCLALKPGEALKLKSDKIEKSTKLVGGWQVLFCQKYQFIYIITQCSNVFSQSIDVNNKSMVRKGILNGGKYSNINSEELQHLLRVDIIKVISKSI